jgi:hypothetical protein
MQSNSKICEAYMRRTIDAREQLSSRHLVALGAVVRGKQCVFVVL